MNAFAIFLALTSLCCTPLLANTIKRPVRLGSKSKKAPDEQKLIQKMFLKYNRNVRPVLSADTAVNVTFGVTLIQVMDLDERDQIFVTNMWLEHAWLDERLTWNPSEFNGVDVIRVPPSKLWLPDIVLYNNADDYTGGYMPANVVLRHDGGIYWAPPARLRSSCKVDITYFPFDSQICHLKFGSWTYDQAQVDIINKSHTIDVSNYITNGEWSLMHADVIRNEIVYPISDAVYPDVTAIISIRRLTVYYLLNIICPCIWLNTLSLLAFILPPASGEKIALGITVLLSYSVFMLLVAENMPSTSEFVPLIGIYLTLSMAVTSVSVILTVCILKLHHGGPVQHPVPSWLRKIVLIYLAPIVHCHPGCISFRPQQKRRFDNCIDPVEIDCTTRLFVPSNPAATMLSPEERRTAATLNHVTTRNTPSPLSPPIHYAPPASPPRRPTVNFETPPPLLNYAPHTRRHPSSYIPEHIEMTQPVRHFSNQTYDSDALRFAIPLTRPKYTAHRRAPPPPRPARTHTRSLQRYPAIDSPDFEAERVSDLKNASPDGVGAEILDNLKLIVSRRDDDEEEDVVRNEWQQIAQVIDRTLFYFFLVVTVAVTGTLVVIIPLSIR